MFEKEINEYERIRQEYQEKIADRMGEKQWMEYNEILFSAHSCAIEGNSFTVDDTRILREQGMAMIPVGRSLLECTEMADHFRAFDYMVSHLDQPFDEALLKEVNRLVTEHTLAYRVPGCKPSTVSVSVREALLPCTLTVLLTDFSNTILSVATSITILASRAVL